MKHPIFFLLALGLLTSCVSVRMETEIESGTDFAQYRTYRMDPGLVSGMTPDAEARFSRFLQDELRSVGLRPAEDGDLLVDYRSLVRLEEFRPNMAMGTAGTNALGGSFVAENVTLDIEPHLLLDLVFRDAETQRPVWQARMRKEIRGKSSAEEIVALLDPMLLKALDAYPSGQ